MTEQMKIAHRLDFEGISTKKLIRALENPVRVYEDEMIDGAIIDIGCGQSSTLLDYLESGRELIAVDNEPSQLDYLKQRVQNYGKGNLDDWTFQCTNFPADGVPKKDYALIILSNILHFYTLEDCIKIGKLLTDISQPGTLIYSRVHSYKHFSNTPEDPNNNDYFKHYFSVEDMDSIFPYGKFERLYCAEVENANSQTEMKIQMMWIEEVYRKLFKINNRREIENAKKEHIGTQKESGILTVYRRK